MSGKFNRYSYLLVCCIVLLLSTNGFTQSTNNVWTHITNYIGQEADLRQTVTLSQLHYVFSENKRLYYKHYRGRYFPVRTQIPVTFKKFVKKDDYVRAEFVNDAGKKGKIDFYWAEGEPRTKEDFDLMIKSAFVFENASPEPMYIGNKFSEIYHAFGSNHLPSQENSIKFSSAEDAEANGMSECKACFYGSILVTDYQLEERMGRQTAAAIAMNYPVVMDDSKQSMIRESGKRVLEKWPLPLIGYDYSFTLIRSAEPNALAVPAGRVFVTTGLLDVLESEDELDAVIAHEIAHVEKRHGLRQLKKAQKAAAIAQGAALGGAILGAILGDDNSSSGAEIGYTLTAIVASIVQQISVSGYSRNLEQESDTFAHMYFQMNNNPDGRFAMQNMLRKLRFSSDVRGFGHNVDAFSSHPHIDSRIARAESGKLHIFSPILEFEGYDKDGELLATLTFESQMTDKIVVPGRRSQKKTEFLLSLFASVKASQFLEDAVEVKDIKFTANGVKLALDNEEDTTLFPGGNIGTVFTSKKIHQFIEGTIENIEINGFARGTTWKLKSN